MRKMLLTIGVLFTTSPATAGEQPITFPTRDVVVDATQSVDSMTVQQTRTFYLAAEQKSRTELGQFGIYVIMDFKARSVVTVYAGQPPTYQSSPLPAETTGDLIATGNTDKIEGYECTEWQTPPSVHPNPGAGAPGQAPTYVATETQCVTAEGVPLRTVNETNLNGVQSKVTNLAKNVSFEQLDKKLFRLPPDAVQK
jgi:hypothetical protein